MGARSVRPGAPDRRDIPNQPMLFRIGTFWFSVFALIAAVIYAAGDRVQHVTPLDKLFVDRASPSATS